MRAAPCIALELPLTQRVALLMEDYAHFVSEPQALNTRLDCLLSLHGRSKIDEWKDLANQGEMTILVAQLLEKHYDPAYLRSIDKNFPQSSNALQIKQEGIAATDFAQSAQRIVQSLARKS